VIFKSINIPDLKKKHYIWTKGSSTTMLATLLNCRWCSWQTGTRFEHLGS